MTSGHVGTLILGSPRSGTTLLRRLIGGHPRIHCASETNVFTACGRFLRQERIVGETPVGALSGLAFAGIPEQETLTRLRDLAFGFHRDLAVRAGKPRWASKTAFDAFYLDEIEALTAGHASYVCIVRHGLDVVCSLEELCARNGTYLQEIHEYVRRYPSPREAFAQLWVDVTERLLSFQRAHAADACLIRYEDLTTQAEATMATVFAALGESSEGWSLGATVKNQDELGLGDWKAFQRDSVQGDSIGRFRTLPPTEITRLAAIVNPTLERAGYEPIATRTLPSAEQARRRYQLGLMLPQVPGKDPGKAR